MGLKFTVIKSVDDSDAIRPYRKAHMKKHWSGRPAFRSVYGVDEGVYRLMLVGSIKGTPSISVYFLLELHIPIATAQP